MILHAGNNAFLWLSGCLLVLSVSMYTQVQGWIQVVMACSFFIRLALYFKLQKHLPSVRTLNLLALLSALVLAYFSFQLGILLAMVNLLVLACSLKLMQLRTNRDFYQLVTSLFFLLGSGFIFEQSMGYSVLYIGVAFALLVTMKMFQSPSQPSFRQLKGIATMSLKALPVALLLFLVFPKLGPLWQMPTSKPTESGLSDTVTPGDIAELSQSSELAFRVTFDGDIPPSYQRYWRAITLESFDGKSWYQSSLRLQARRQYKQYRQEFAPNVKGASYLYEVLAEPTQQRWLYGLDIAVPQGSESNINIWQGYDYQLMSNRPLVSTFQYQVASYPDVELNQSLESLDRRINLRVPGEGNPRTQQWVKQLRETYPDDRELIQAVMNYFRQQEFRYTLRPDSMPVNPVDHFLFDTKAGFCAHYASAMAYVLRLANIPARMVTGYQGGEMRENSYLSVYQYDAHAWVETWYDDSGWQRFDPTAMVAPDRIRFGLERAMQEEGSFLADSPFSLAKLKSIPWLNDFRLALADIDYLWSRWVLGFDQQSQQDLFKSLLGKVTPKRLMYLSFAVLLLISLMMALFFLPVWYRKKAAPEVILYQKALSLLQKHGITRETWQGPHDFAQYVEQQSKPLIAVPFKRITSCMIEHQYKPEKEKRAAKNVHLMKQQLRLLRASVRAARSG